MPKRKVIQLAGKTLVVSLPSKWAKRCGVRKGDEIDVDESGRRLILGASSSRDAGKASIDLTGLSERTIRWALSALHKKGHDEIEAKYSDSKSLRIIEELMKDLFTGFVITKQGNNKCTIKAIAKESEEEFDSILRRAFLVTLSMGDNIVDLMKKGLTNSAPEILVLEKTNNQLTNFCERILIKRGAKMSENSCMTYAIVWNLEKIADDYKYICNEISQRNAKPGRSTIELHEKVNALLRGYYALFYKFDLASLDRLAEERSDISESIKKCLSKNRDITIINHLSSMLHKISDFSASMAGISLPFEQQISAPR